jgi:hypothetical protein
MIALNEKTLRYFLLSENILSKKKRSGIALLLFDNNPAHFIAGFSIN